MISNPEESAFTYCNAPLQHTTATHHCNAPLQHTTATHHCNAPLQHTQFLLTAAADNRSGLKSQGICVNLLQHITATHTATHYCNTPNVIHFNFSQHTLQHTRQHITAKHHCNNHCNTLNVIHMGPQPLTPGVVSNTEESTFKFVMIIVTLLPLWLCFIMHSKSLIR